MSVSYSGDMPLLHIWLLLLLPVENYCRKLSESVFSDDTRLARQQGTDKGVFTDTTTNTNHRKLVDEENASRTTSSNGNRRDDDAGSNDVKKADTYPAHLRRWTFEICDPSNVCRNICKQGMKVPTTRIPPGPATEDVHVGKFGLSPDGLPIGYGNENVEIGKFGVLPEGPPLGSEYENVEVGKFGVLPDGPPIGSEYENVEVGKFGVLPDGSPTGSEYENVEVGNVGILPDGLPTGSEYENVQVGNVGVLPDGPPIDSGYENVEVEKFGESPGVSTNSFGDVDIDKLAENSTRPTTGGEDHDPGEHSTQVNYNETSITNLITNETNAVLLDPGTREEIVEERMGITDWDVSKLKVRLKRTAQSLDIPVAETKQDQWRPEEQCTLQGRACSCDKYCVIFGDCCSDIFEYWSGENNVSDPVGLIAGVISRTTFPVDLANLVQVLRSNVGEEEKIINNFLLEFASCEEVNKNVSIYAVSRCPVGTHDPSLVENCEKLNSSLTPPILATLPGGSLVFKNVFCAHCHHIPTSYLTAWFPKITCKDGLEVTSNAKSVADLLNLIGNDTCKVSYSDNLQTYPSRHCFPDNSTNVASNESRCTEMNRLLCEAYRYPYNGYKNPHCEKCLELENTTLEEVFTVECNESGKNAIPEDSLGILVILDVSGRFSQSNTGKVSYICGEEEVFDPLSYSCKALICGLGYKPYRGSCLSSDYAIVPSTTQIYQTGYNILHVQTNITFPPRFPSCAEIRSQIRNVMQKLEKVINSRFYLDGALSPSFNILLNEQCDYINITDTPVHIHIDEPVTIKQELTMTAIGNFTKMIKEFLKAEGRNFTNQIIITNVEDHTHFQNGCQSGYAPKERNGFEIVEINGEIYASVNYSETKLLYSLKNIGFSMIFTSRSGSPDVVIVSSDAYLCEESPLFSNEQCVPVSYWLNQTRRNGSILTILESQQTYDRDNFVIRGSEVFVCSNFEAALKSYHRPGVRSVFTLTVTLISLLFLCWMLVLYGMFPELLTLPGKLTACLTLTLMLTFVLSLIPLAEIQNKYACAFLAGVNHFVTVAYFWWMASIAFNMAWTFGPSSSSLVKTVDDSQTFRGFNIFVWGMSSAIVLPSIILDVVHRQSSPKTETNTTLAEPSSSIQAQPLSSYQTQEYPLYGGENCVWFSAPLWARLVFIIAPYFISFLSTVIGFSLTLIGLNRSRKISEKVGKGSSEFTHCLIYAKLSTAMGFSWVLSAVIQIYPDSLVLLYVFQSLTLLQGLLLFLAFMANRRVYALISQKMKSRSTRGTNTSSSIATSSNKTY